MIASLRQNQFDSVLCPIDFNDKGDLSVQNLVWYVWRDGGYMPLEEDLPMNRLAERALIRSKATDELERCGSF